MICLERECEGGTKRNKKKMKLRVYNTPLPHIQSRRYYLVGNHILRKTEQSFNVYSYYFARC